jgi:hypothetical protein
MLKSAIANGLTLPGSRPCIAVQRLAALQHSCMSPFFRAPMRMSLDRDRRVFAANRLEALSTEKVVERARSSFG